LTAAKAQVGAEYVELDAQKSTIRFHRPGVRLNLGSIGKGYAVDRAVESMLADGVTDFLVHGGYSSAAARGFAGFVTQSVATTVGWTSGSVQHGETDPEVHPTNVRQFWTVGVKDPLRQDVRVGQIELHDRALGTSGAQHQSFRHRGRRYGHILDPRSGWPADGVLAATVLAPTAAESDALSTAFYVLGPQWAMDYCRRHPAIAAVMFCPAEGKQWEMHRYGVELITSELR
jgi:FAD:protein FMN transferase